MHLHFTGFLGVLIILPFGVLSTALFRKSQPLHRPTAYLNEWFEVPAKDVSSDEEYATDVESQSSVSTCRSDVVTIQSNVSDYRSSIVTSYDSFATASPSPSQLSFKSPVSTSAEGLQKSGSTFSSAMGSDTDAFKLPRFPKWSVYVAWALVLLLSAFFTAYVVAFSLKFTMIRMTYCIESMLISALVSIVVVETLVVFLYASYYVYRYKKVDELYIAKTDALSDRCVQGKYSLHVACRRNTSSSNFLSGDVARCGCGAGWEWLAGLNVEQTKRRCMSGRGKMGAIGERQRKWIGSGEGIPC